VLSISPEAQTRRSDVLAVEEPLELRLDGETYGVTMRTPGHDVELAHGLLHSEGVIADAADVVVARYCAGVGPDGLNTYNVLDVSLAATAVRPAAADRRQMTSTSACGICGTTTIDQVMRKSRHQLPDDVVWPTEILTAGPLRLRDQQRAFAQTGGLHAAGLLAADGTMLCVREDVGRHNAVDKVVGWALRERRLPLGETALIVSGRASYELTQKAVLAGIPVLVAVSAPSSLAVELADQARLTLVGFARGATMNVYTAPERVRAREESARKEGAG